MGNCPVAESPKCYYHTNCFAESETDLYTALYEGKCDDLADFDCHESTLDVAVW